MRFFVILYSVSGGPLWDIRREVALLASGASRLVRLDLRAADLGPGVLSAVARALASDTTLTDLDLRDNPSTGRGGGLPDGFQTPYTF